MSVAVAPGRPEAAPGGPPLEVALVNNMPDAAFEEAEAQFAGLLEAAAGGRGLCLRRFSVPTPGRTPAVLGRLAAHYEDLEDLYRRPPDVVLVTGSTPQAAALRDEDLWPALSRLVRWAVGASSSAVFSCLAAHAALAELAGAERRALVTKASGVYRQRVRAGHPLTEGLGPVALPHSRCNEVPTGALGAGGFEVLLDSEEAGWGVAASSGDGRVLLLQGHPEYGPTTLLREYRRDVADYRAGRRATHPEVPEGYLDAQGVAMLEERRASSTAGGAIDALLFEAVAEHVLADWRAPMVRLFDNWLTETVARRASRAWRRAG